MSYYRAALKAASINDLSEAARLARCSIAFNEAAPDNIRLLKLIEKKNGINEAALRSLRPLILKGRYRKALKVKLPPTSKAYTVRGLLYARIGCSRKAKKAFIKALILDTGNEAAKRALNHLMLPFIKRHKQ